jgi:hypothetical protein
MGGVSLTHVTWHSGKTTMDGPEQVILESEPYRKLSYAWHDFTPEFAAEAGEPLPTRA